MRAGLAAAAIGGVVVAGAARKLPLAVASAAFVLAGTAIGAARLDAIDHSELRPLIGHSVTARGHVVKRERPTPRARRFRLRLEVVSAGREAGASAEGTGAGEVVQVQVRAGVALRPMAIGDEAVVEGALEQPVRRPDSSFDYAEYLRRAGVHALLYADSVRLTGRRRGGLAGIVDTMRRRAEAGVARGLDPPMAALAHGMVLGEDERISAAMTDDFKASGLAHLLAERIQDRAGRRQAPTVVPQGSRRRQPRRELRSLYGARGGDRDSKWTRLLEPGGRKSEDRDGRHRAARSRVTQRPSSYRSETEAEKRDRPGPRVLHA